MSNVKELQAHRNQIAEDLANGIVPERMLVSASLPFALGAEFGGLSPIDYQFDYSKLAEPARKLCDMIYSDSCPVAPPGIISRTPSFHQVLNSRSFQMSSEGTMQHPEVSAMEENEFSELIDHPFDFLVEKVIPRQYPALNTGDPIEYANRIRLAFATLEANTMSFVPTMLELIEKHGYTNRRGGGMGFGVAPFDFLADQLRGFSKISLDIRRHRSELKDAAEAVTPLLLYWMTPAIPGGTVFFPLHMPTFMREKDFEELYLPTYKKVLQQLAARGVRPGAFLEDDWTRFFDIILDEFPAGTKFQLEKGDPRTVIDKLGDKFLLSGMFPLATVKFDEPDRACEKLQEFLDIVMEKPTYQFGYDKILLGSKDARLDTLAAVNEYLRDHSYYDNAGEKFGPTLNEENFTRDTSYEKGVESRHFLNWEAYKEKYPMVPDFVKEDYAQKQKKFVCDYVNMLV